MTPVVECYGKKYRHSFFPVIVMVLCSLSFGTEKVVTFCAVGDILLDRGIRKTIERYGKNNLFQKVKERIQDHDLAFFNLECPLVERDSAYPITKKYVFRADPSSSVQLKNAGFNLASIANNHTIDMGRESFLHTIRTLLQNNIYPIGGGMNYHEAVTPVVIVKNGVVFAFFAYQDFLLEGVMCARSKPGPATGDFDSLCTMIQLYDRIVDHVVVSFHWGMESQVYPNSNQFDKAHRVIDSGADLVIGHHPHVLQSVEFHRGKLILYSLGNFLFDNKKQQQKETVIFTCTASKDRLTGFRLYPIELINNRPEIASEKTGKRITQRIRRISRDMGVSFSEEKACMVLSVDNGAELSNQLAEYAYRGFTVRVREDEIDVQYKNNVVAVQKVDYKHHIIQDCCMERVNDTLSVYTIIGKRGKKRGRRLAVFSFDYQNEAFLDPALDVHEQYNPWKIRLLDVDNDGNKELLVGVWKTTRYDSTPANRLFVFNKKHGYIYPKWLGSKIGFSFMNFTVEEGLEKKCNSLLLLEKRPETYYLKRYGWNGFGFSEIETINEGIGL